MGNALTVLGILAGCAFAAFAYFSYVRHDDPAFKSILAGFIISGLAFLAYLFWLIHKARGWFSKRFVRRSGVADPPPSRPPVSEGGEKLKFRFGVYWDSDLNPLCPVCKTPLTLSIKNLMYAIDPFNNSIPPPKPVPHCLKCNQAILLYDDDGKYITLSEARWRLSRENPDNPKRLQAIERLQTIRGHLPAGDVKEKYIDKYHQALREIENYTGCKLIQHSIPPNELKYIETHLPRERRIGNIPGLPARTTRSEDRYCDRAVFLIALDGAIASLRR